jgi:hypothetical protein
MSKVSDLINRAHRQLMSGVVEERNKLAASVSASATSFTLLYEVSGARVGAVVEINSEQCYVWELSESSKTITVERGFNGTTPAAHTANSIVTVNPRFPRSQLFEAINDEMSDLSSPMHGMFQVKNIDIKYNGSDRQVNIPVFMDVIDLIDVRWRNKSDDHRLVNGVKLIRNLPTKDFGSATAIQIDTDVPVADVRVTYKSPYGVAESENDDLQVNCGYPQTAEDILIIGAQIRMMSSREIKRNFTESQGDTRRSDEVPPGAVGNSITNLIRLRRDRITAEAAKLARQYPTFLSR